MRNHAVKRALRFLLPRILAAALAVFWAVGVAQGAEVKLNRVSGILIEITGGTGPEAWRLRYGTAPPSGDLLALAYRPVKPQLVPGENGLAWFAHDTWLRLIDTKQGLVIGRWHFPGRIRSLVPAGANVRVSIESITTQHIFEERDLELHLNGPAPPYWPDNELPSYRRSFTEAQYAWPEIGLSGSPHKVTPEQAKKLLPEIEEAVRRDSFTPWFRMALGKLMQDIDDPRASAVFREGVHVPSADFTELFTISTFLDDVGEHETAREAFERGYQDYWERGNDPRLFVALWHRLFIYRAPFGPPGTNLSAEQRRERIDRVYRLTPYAEGSGLAWRLYADYLQKSADSQDARLWRARAQETQKESLWRIEGPLTVDQALLAVMASVLTFVFYTVALYGRYRPQRRLDIAARKRAVESSGAPSIGSIKTWQLWEQGAFFVIAFGAWLAAFFAIGPLDSIAGRVFAALSFAFPITVLYVLILHWRFHRKARLDGKAEEATGDRAFSALQMKTWSWGQRYGLFAVLIAAWVASYVISKPGRPPFALAVLSIYPAIGVALVYLLILYVVARLRGRGETRATGRFSWFNTIYWSRRERVGFLTTVFVAWFSLGVCIQGMEGILRRASSPVSFGSGSFAGPVNEWYLENRLPQSPQRDLLLAFSYQESGEADKAERLYRSLPQFAESWNNLGVLLKSAGKNEEGRQAFERALQIDPGVAEAALNLGRPPQDFWTEQHQKYLPGRPMLAPPRKRHLVDAFLGGSLGHFCARALLGPFALSELGRVAGSF